VNEHIKYLGHLFTLFVVKICHLMAQIVILENIFNIKSNENHLSVY